jgi:hypothetical protein
MKKLFTILAVAVCINTNAQVCFMDTNFSVSSNNTSITCADFNGDGNLDLAVAYYDDSHIYILFGDGHGGFMAADTINSGSPYFIISGDFNGDGKADLAVAEWGNTTVGYVQILFGDGTGHFPTTSSFAVGPYPVAICAADFNGDGHIDLATANKNGNLDNVSVILGDGAGHFSSPTNFSVGYSPASITSGDFNGDGKADLAVAINGTGGPDSVWVLLGDGTGNFGTPAKYLCGTSPNSVCSADFNGDGFADLAVANVGSGDVSVLISKGTSGAFFPAVNYTAGPAPSSEPGSVVSADFNLDGKLDLAIADRYNPVFILLGNGDGTFGASTYFSAFSPEQIITADFNGDGKPDLATADFNMYHGETVLLNCSSAGIVNINNEPDYSIYPNPTTGNFTVETKITGKQTVLINDLNGKLVLSQNINDKINIDATGLNNGIYNLVIKSDEGIINKKLVIVK